MNVEEVISELNKKYPGASVFKNDEENTTEILCEIEPTYEHPEYSNAIAVIDKSIAHVHYKSTETYKVIRGDLKLFVGKDKIELSEGDTYVISSGIPHWAEGNETWVECYSEPGWTVEDHIFLEDLENK